MATRLDSTMREFCRMVMLSGLVDSAPLNGLLREFESDAEWQSRFGNTVTGFSSFLVGRGVLTCWQCDKLRHGKHKGFFMDGLKLIDWVSAEEDHSRYRAVEVASGRRVVVCVRPLNRVLNEGETAYWVIDDDE